MTELVFAHNRSGLWTFANTVTLRRIPELVCFVFGVVVAAVDAHAVLCIWRIVRAFLYAALFVIIP